MYFVTVQGRTVPEKFILRHCRVFASTKAELYRVSFIFAFEKWIQPVHLVFSS